MSYRDDLKEFREGRRRHRRMLSLIIKTTVVALAVVFLAATVMVIVDTVGGNSDIPSGVSSSSSDGKDTKAPVIALANGLDAIYAYVGENVSYKTAVKVTDNSGTYTLDIDRDDVNLDKEGKYTVIYTAKDGAGNSATLEVTIVVSQKKYTYDELMSAIARKAATLGITSDMSKREQVEAVYDYVNSKVEYGAESNIPNIDRDDWEIDWVMEAAMTMESKPKVDTYDMRGDCYSYYSLSKAFFEYLDIEHVGIQRDNSDIPSKEGTHFWLMVNIGDKTAQWYYFDATRLNGKFTSDGTKSGCLMTLGKIQSYEPSKNLGYNFYEFDPSDYPTAATK